MFLSLLLLATCASCVAPDGTNTPGEKGIDALAMTHSPHLCQKEFNCVRAEFDARIRYWHGSSDVPFQHDDSRQVVKWADLNGAVGALNAFGTLGIRIHYGLDDADTTKPVLRFALQPMMLTKESMVFHDAQPINEKVWVVGNDGTLSNSDTLTWQGGPQANYQMKVRIQRDADAKFAQPAKGEDPTSYTFRWDELLSLHMANGSPELLRINAIASPNVRRFENGKWYEADWMHRLALTAVDEEGEDIISDDASSDLKDRALELGTPCPPRCRKYLQHRYGQLPHNACACP